MLFLLGIYGGGFVVTLLLITLVTRLEGSTAEAEQTWHYVWQPSFLWPVSVPAFLLVGIDAGIKWFLKRPTARSAQLSEKGSSCSRCSTPLPPSARYCGRCGKGRAL